MMLFTILTIDLQKTLNELYDFMLIDTMIQNSLTICFDRILIGLTMEASTNPLFIFKCVCSIILTERAEGI